MKYNSRKHEPNGMIPPIIRVGMAPMNQGCAGIFLGMLLVLTGNSIASFLKPMVAPKKTSGVEIPNQRAINVTIVWKGTASDLFCENANKFKTKNSIKAIPGNPIAVSVVAFCQLFPLNVLYKRDIAYPATNPIST